VGVGKMEDRNGREVMGKEEGHTKGRKRRKNKF
jgi:hypothetical protein